MNDFNWQDQWRQHAPGYSEKEQLAIVDVSEWCSNYQDRLIKMRAGPGFGDLSHPTTHLMLRLMGNHMKGKHVVDIGCGSGVLGLCALAMGAAFVYAVDIDPEALAHTAENAKLNHMQSRCIPYFAEDLPALPGRVKWTFLINMIRTEQKAAWTSLPLLHSLPAEIIASGILAEDKQTYVSLVKGWGWTLEHEVQEGEWLGLVFKKPL